MKSAKDEARTADCVHRARLEELDLSISYLFKVVQNLLRRRYSRSVRLREILAEQITPHLQRQADLESERGCRSAVEIVAELQELDEAFTRLAGDERDAIRMVVFEGLSYAEAARSLGVSVTTINNWKHRGLSKLRKFAEKSSSLAQGTALATG